MKCQGLYLGSEYKDSWFEVDRWVIKITSALGVAVPLALGENQWRCSKVHCYMYRRVTYFPSEVRLHSTRHHHRPRAPAGPPARPFPCDECKPFDSRDARTSSSQLRFLPRIRHHSTRGDCGGDWRERERERVGGVEEGSGVGFRVCDGGSVRGLFSRRSQGGECQVC
jgi:hypothetical protein